MRHLLVKNGMMPFIGHRGLNNSIKTKHCLLRVYKSDAPLCPQARELTKNSMVDAFGI